MWNAYWELLHSELLTVDDIPSNRPLLAHYTSLQNVENILRNEEFWLSNPLDMNDTEEVAFGVENGRSLVHSNKDLKSALGTDERRDLFYQALDRAYDGYAKQHVLDLYIMCFSLHQASDEDGKLSMWRGYGNAGKGAAIIFDPSKIPIQLGSPLALAPVEYASQEKRRELIKNKIDQVAGFFREKTIPSTAIETLARALFQRICLFAIFSKHIGFIEEREWRLVYFKDRDSKNSFTPFFGYFNGPEGIKSKLKLPMKPTKDVINDDFDLSNIIHSIIVGPTSSSPLTKHAIERMLEGVKKPELKSVLRMSSIPYRG